MCHYILPTYLFQHVHSLYKLLFPLCQDSLIKPVIIFKLLLNVIQCFLRVFCNILIGKISNDSSSAFHISRASSHWSILTRGFLIKKSFSCFFGVFLEILRGLIITFGCVAISSSVNSASCWLSWWLISSQSFYYWKKHTKMYRVNIN